VPDCDALAPLLDAWGKIPGPYEVKNVSINETSGLKELDLAGPGCEMIEPEGALKSLREIEHSLTKTYKKDLWSRFVQAINDYEMLKPGDKVAVAISGGKDSMLLAKLFQELKRHNKYPFEVEFISMDPGYHPEIRKLMETNCQHLGIPLNIFEKKVFESVGKLASDYPCYLCAKMRRGILYKKARELGCNKVALGHHYDDVIETTLLNLFFQGTFGTMMPKLKSTNYPGIELIRPMYYIREKDILRFTQASGIWPLNCACMVAAKRTSNRRYELKRLLETLKAMNPDVEKCLFHAAENVDMGTVLGWRHGQEKHTFLDLYEQRMPESWIQTNLEMEAAADEHHG
jgi:tRNA(Ile)-lysidine synthase TilS/MesJ